MSANTYGIGIVGAGVIFEDHARAVESLDGRVRLIGVADTDPVKLSHAADRHAVAITTSDYQQLLEREDVDLIAVCTPPSTHERIVIDALEAGKHVLCEKPLAHTVAAADRITEAARRHPGKLSVVYQLRYVPDIRRIAWLRDNNRLGQLVCGHFIRFDTFDPHAVNWWGRWDTAGGGVAMTQFIHQLDLACHLFGPPASVHANMDTFTADIESEDTFSATVRFHSGAVVSCAATLAARTTLQQWHVFGTRGSVQSPFVCETDNPAQLERDLQQLAALYPPLSGPARQPSNHIVARAFRKGLRLLRIGGHVQPPRPACLHLPYYRVVLDAIDAGQPLPITPEQATTSLELCTGIYISGLTGETVELPLDRNNPYCQGINADDYQAQQSAANHNAVASLFETHGDGAAPDASS